MGKAETKFRIRTKILIAFLGLSVASLLLFGFIALRNITGVGKYALKSSTSLGENAAGDSANALEYQAQEYLLRLAKDQAAISNMLFEKVEGETNLMVEFASTLWSDPSSFGIRKSYSRMEKPDDIYAASVYLLAPGISVDEVKEELNFSSNMDDVFIPIYAIDSNLDPINLGTESGMYRRYPWRGDFPFTYDPRKRSWYQRAVKSGKMGWTELYVAASGVGLMVTCSAPIYGPEDKIVGVIGSDVTLKAINERIINTQVGKYGYAFLIDNNGRIIASPELSAEDKRWDKAFETRNLLNSDNPELKKIAENMTAGKTGIGRCRLEDDEKYISYAPITSTNWSIGIVMPVMEIIAPALTTENKINVATQVASKYINNEIFNTRNTFVGLLVLLVMIVSGMSLLLSRTITNPITKLTKGAKAIGKGDLEYRVQIDTNDELKELAGSFNKMASDLKEHIEVLKQTTAEKERMQKELEIARGIQQSFLPKEAPAIKGIELAASTLPAREVGGDFYDFIPVTKDKWGLVIADVSGKGIPAALFMALSRTLIRASTMRNSTTETAIKYVNERIYTDAKSNMFVTVFYGIVDSKNMCLKYVNAGHNPPLLLRKRSNNVILLKSTGFVLGIVEDIELPEKEIKLKKGDAIVFYTDGITEAINVKKEQFGEERLFEIIKKNRNLSAQDMIKLLQDKVRIFSGKQPQFDDITLMILKVK